MPSLISPNADPVSSGEMQALDPERGRVVEARHRAVADLTAEYGLDGVLLTDPATIAWFTCGSRLQLRGLSQSGGAVFVTPQARVVICRSSESGQFFDREVAALGFQLKERPWGEPRGNLLADLCNGRRMGIEGERVGSVDLTESLGQLRRPSTAIEEQSLRSLCEELTHAVEAACRTCEQGQTESEVAGQVAHRLYRHGLTPSVLQVMADAQGHRYRHWNHGPDAIQRYATIHAVAERNGLFAGVARTVSFGPPPRAIRNAHEVCSLVQAAGLFFSQSDWTADEVWKRVVRMYEKLGAADEWRQAEQASVIGYRVSEQLFTPDARFPLPPGTVVHWHPSVRTAMTGDTMLVREEGFELLTVGERWPQLNVVVKGHAVDRPAILIRDDAAV